MPGRVPSTRAVPSGPAAAPDRSAARPATGSGPPGGLCSATTSRTYRASCARRDTSTGSVTASGVRHWLMTHANGAMPARFRSAWSFAASCTGVASGRVTISTRVKSGSRSRGSRFSTASGMPLACRVTSRWYARAESSSRIVCPVGAVSRTTNPPSPSATAAANARNTAISSVHGDRRSSSSIALPWASRSLPGGRHDLGRVRRGLGLRVDARRPSGSAPRRSGPRRHARPGRWCSAGPGTRGRPGPPRPPRRPSSCRRRPCPSS